MLFLTFEHFTNVTPTTTRTGLAKYAVEDLIAALGRGPNLDAFNAFIHAAMHGNFIDSIRRDAGRHTGIWSGKYIFCFKNTSKCLVLVHCMFVHLAIVI
jgi:hypothetical protein